MSVYAFGFASNAPVLAQNSDMLPNMTLLRLKHRIIQFNCFLPVFLGSNGLEAYLRNIDAFGGWSKPKSIHAHEHPNKRLQFQFVEFGESVHVFIRCGIRRELQNKNRSLLTVFEWRLGLTHMTDIMSLAGVRLCTNGEVRSWACTAFSVHSLIRQSKYISFSFPSLSSCRDFKCVRCQRHIRHAHLSLGLFIGAECKRSPAFDQSQPQATHVPSGWHSSN
jgi:hypothetical protein